MPDNERRIKCLRRELEGWREVLVGLHSVLIWEKQFYPAVTTSVISFIFLLIWYIDPAVLTFLSFVGLLITLGDYLVPQVMPWVFGADHWTGSHERKYDQIITSLAGVCGKVSDASSSFHSIKTSRPKTYFVIVTSVLMTFAWIGSSVNNLFLTYLLVVLAALLPGLRKQSIFQKYFAIAMQNLSKMLKGTTKAVGSEEEKSNKKD